MPNNCLQTEGAQEKGMMDCIWKFVATNPGQIKGWTCQLNETVRILRVILSFMGVPTIKWLVKCLPTFSYFNSRFPVSYPNISKKKTVNIRMPRNSSKKKVSERNLSSSTQAISSQLGTEQLHDQSSQPEPRSLVAATDEDPSEPVCPTVLVKTEVETRENDSRPRMVSQNFPRSSVSNVNTQYCWAYSAIKVPVLADKCLKRNLKVLVTRKMSVLTETTVRFTVFLNVIIMQAPQDNISSLNIPVPSVKA